MGTRASLAFAIVVKEQLWGLVVCHSAVPKTVSFQLRMAGEFLVQALAMRLSNLMDLENHVTQDRCAAQREGRRRAERQGGRGETVDRGRRERREQTEEGERGKGMLCAGGPGREVSQLGSDAGWRLCVGCGR